jgi:hypothetical protein
MFANVRLKVNTLKLNPFVCLVPVADVHIIAIVVPYSCWLCNWSLAVELSM